MEDVAFTTFDTWGVGRKGVDDGVLLLIAPDEHDVRIETGKGVGDRLTDLEASRILRESVGPLLKQERFREAILAGLARIEAALDAPPRATVPVAPAPAAAETSFWWSLVVGMFSLSLVIALFLLRRGDRRAGRRAFGYDPSSAYGASQSAIDASSHASFHHVDVGGGGGFTGGGGGGDFGGGASGGGGGASHHY